MDVYTLIALMEEAIVQRKVEDVPAFLGGLERLKAILWSRMMTVSCSSTSNQLSDAGTLLTMPQVAKRLAIPEGRAYELARQRKLPTVKVGKYVRVSVAEFVKWVAQQTSLERQIDREPSDFHSALARKKRPAQVPTHISAHRGRMRGQKDGPAMSKSQPKSQVGIRPQVTTPCSSAVPGSVEEKASQEKA